MYLFITGLGMSEDEKYVIRRDSASFIFMFRVKSWGYWQEEAAYAGRAGKGDE